MNFKKPCDDNFLKIYHLFSKSNLRFPYTCMYSLYVVYRYYILCTHIQGLLHPLQGKVT